MKLRRLLSITLALLLAVSLLVVSLLPVSVLATDIQPGEPTEVFAQQTIDNNYGDVGSNYGTIKNNVTVDGVTKSGFVGHNYGTVENNYGIVERNTETITNNNGTVGVKTDGTIESLNGNFGTIKTNNGTVYNNQKDGTVETNNKTIEENYGTVGKREENGTITPGSGNFGTINGNKGTVLINQEGGIVKTNNGTVEENNGTVETNNDTVEKNNGTVETNCGTVKTNNGKITDNNWDVDTNGTNGTIETNDNHVTNNNGRIITNNDSVNYNSGTIETNNGKVYTNSGTVETNAIDGIVNNCQIDAGESVVYKGTVTQNFGTVVDETSSEGKTYYGLSWGDSVEKLTSIESFVEKDTQKNLDEIAQGVQRSGYKMTGYTAYYRDDGKDVKIDSTADYRMKAPTWLQILWEKIVSKSESHASESHSDDDTATPVRTVTYPTKVAAEDVKVGTIVQRKGMRFQVIEMDDGSILVATVGKLSKKDIEDMKAFLAKYFTAEQLEMLLGDPELLSDELVAKYFGGSLAHICFRAAKDIFAQ